MKKFVSILSLFSFVFIATVYAQQPSPAGQKRGYKARACGLDMNRNGIYGEPADCNVCDGVTADPDGDGINEDINYVDSSAGADNASCGGPQNPCRTIQFVLNGSNTSFPQRSDGPGDGAEDIVCIKGVFNLSSPLVPKQSGIAQQYTTSSFQFPKNPVMIVGWDADNDGSYPPFDSDDVAILDGQSVSKYAINNSSAKSYIELAHFEARNFGDGNSNSGFFEIAPGSGAVSHIFVHDLEVDSVNRQAPLLSSNITFDMFGGPETWVAIINNNLTNIGAYFMRGSGNGQNHVRIAFNSIKYNGCPGNVCSNPEWQSAVVGVKMFDEIDNTEVLFNIFDSNAPQWNPAAGGANNGIHPDTCSQGWTIRGNEIINFKSAVIIQGTASSSFCQTRNLDDVIIDQNIIRVNYVPFAFGDNGIRTTSGSSVTNTVEDLTITNNFLFSSVGWEACIWIQNTAPGTGTYPGQTIIAGNTCVNDINRHAALVIGNPEGTENSARQNNFIVRNNIFVQFNGSNEKSTPVNIWTHYAPTNWQSDGNIFEPAGRGFAWNQDVSNPSPISISSWRSASGGDSVSKECTPEFVSKSDGDLHLLSTDTCANSGGVDITSLTSVDIDGKSRSSSFPDSGAAVVSGGPTSPSSPQNLRILSP